MAKQPPIVEQLRVQIATKQGEVSQFAAAASEAAKLKRLAEKQLAALQQQLITELTRGQ